jgi:hypothetical protein
LGLKAAEKDHTPAALSKAHKSAPPPPPPPGVWLPLRPFARHVRRTAVIAAPRHHRSRQRRFFCDKLLRSFAPRFLDNVYRCKKVSDVGCQQMRLDTEVIKGLLLDLAKEGAAGLGGLGGWVGGCG